MSKVGAQPATESGAGKGRTTKATSAKSTADRSAAKSNEPVSREQGDATAAPPVKKTAKGTPSAAEGGVAPPAVKGKATAKEATAPKAATAAEEPAKKAAAGRQPASKDGGHTGGPAVAARDVARARVATDDRPAGDAGSNGSEAPRGSAAAGERSRTAKKAPAAPEVGAYADDEKFLEEQRVMLQAERAVYSEQATALKAEADSLAQEREPGDVQFDEESGEGGTVTVDRERDLALSAQALAAVEEIDAAMGRIEDHTYGACERCHQPIPKARLRALPFARLCVACKNGGLSRR